MPKKTSVPGLASVGDATMRYTENQTSHLLTAVRVWFGFVLHLRLQTLNEDTANGRCVLENYPVLILKGFLNNCLGFQPMTTVIGSSKPL